MLESLLGGGSKGLFGLDISSSSVKVLELSRKGDRYHVEAYASEALPPNAVTEKTINDPAPVAETIAKAVKRAGVGSKNVALAVSGAAVFTKTIEAPANLSERELEEHVLTEAQNNVPYPIEEVNLDWQVSGPSATNADAVDVLLAACRKEQIDNRVAALEIAGLKPKVIDIEVYAMENACQFLRHQMPDEGTDKTIAVVDTGAQATAVTVLHNLATVYTRDQAFGGRQLTEDVMRHYGMSIEEVQKNIRNGTLPENYEHEVLDHFINDLGQQIDRALQFFFSASSQYTHVDQILLAGGCAHILNVDARIQERLNIPTAVARPFAEMSISSKAKPQQLAKEEASLLIATGLAFRAFD